MAATNIAASHVTFAKIKEGQLYGPENHAGEHIRFVYGTLTINVGTGNTAVYTTAAKIPLDNLFDPAHASFIDVSENHMWTPIATSITNGAIRYAAEFSFGTKKLILTAPGGSTGYSAATISAANADNSINDSAAAFPIFFLDQIIVITGFTGTAANNRIARVFSRTASKIVVTNLNGNADFVDDAAGETVKIRALPTPIDVINGITEYSTATDFLVQTLTGTMLFVGRKRTF